jgi:predicted transglutaminase-like cysteine proteinase
MRKILYCLVGTVLPQPGTRTVFDKHLLNAEKKNDLLTAEFARPQIAQFAVKKWAAATNCHVGDDHSRRRTIPYRAAFPARRSGALIVGLLAAMMLLTGPAAVAKTGLNLFGSQEVRKANLHTFKKWTGMLARNATEMPDKPAMCTPRIVKNCLPGRWFDVVEQLRDHDRSTQMTTVNSSINGGEYALDKQNWGVADYWATPRQFLAKDGDCEDYAIAKYMTLKWLGMDASKMRIVVLQDRRR